jgi:hypothetical protein
MAEDPRTDLRPRQAVLRFLISDLGDPSSAWDVGCALDSTSHTGFCDPRSAIGFRPLAFPESAWPFAATPARPSFPHSAYRPAMASTRRQRRRAQRSGKESQGESSADLLQKALQEANPRYEGGGTVYEREGKIEAGLGGFPIEDLSPLRDFSLRALELHESPVKDLGPLAEQPLEQLYLEQTEVTDLRPLAGLPLRSLYLNRTSLSDLTGLEKAPLQELNLAWTRVADLRPLAETQIESLWLNDCPVSDLSPLAELPLVSLTLENTNVTDLSPLSGVRSLRRLHIGGCPVTDLTPITSVPLQRLVFAPDRIEQGLEAARAMGSLMEVGTSLDGLAPPHRFWRAREDAE